MTARRLSAMAAAAALAASLLFAGGCGKGKEAPPSEGTATVTTPAVGAAEDAARPAGALAAGAELPPHLQRASLRVLGMT